MSNNNKKVIELLTGATEATTATVEERVVKILSGVKSEKIVTIQNCISPKEIQESYLAMANEVACLASAKEAATATDEKEVIASMLTRAEKKATELFGVLAFQGIATVGKHVFYARDNASRDYKAAKEAAITKLRAYQSLNKAAKKAYDLNKLYLAAYLAAEDPEASAIEEAKIALSNQLAKLTVEEVAAYDNAVNLVGQHCYRKPCYEDMVFVEVNGLQVKVALTALGLSAKEINSSTKTITLKVNYKIHKNHIIDLYKL